MSYLDLIGKRTDLESTAAISNCACDKSDKSDKRSQEQRTLDGKTVDKIILETNKMVVFQDEEGRTWRYLHEFNQAWRMVWKP